MLGKKAKNVEITDITRTRVTLVTSDKGGDMKTTTAVNLAMILHHLGYNPLLIDYESSGHAAYAYGVPGWERCKTMFHVLRGETDIEEVIHHTPYGDIIAGNDSIDMIESYYKNIPFAEAAFKLKEQVDKLRRLKRYTHIIGDSQPLIRTLLPVQSILSADDLVFTMQALPFSVISFRKTWKAIAQAKADNPNLRVSGVLICRYGNTIEERGHRASIENWAKVKAMNVFSRPIRAGIAVSSAQGQNKPLFEFSLFGNPTTDYQAFVKDYLAQEQEEK